MAISTSSWKTEFTEVEEVTDEAAETLETSVQTATIE